MVEARKRNPSILLSGLAWTFPGWIGAGTSSPWTNVSLTAGYLVAWLRGARDVYNLTIDYLNADMNERGYATHVIRHSIPCAFQHLTLSPHFFTHAAAARSACLFRRWSSSFVKELRVALDAADFRQTQLVCGDDSHVFSCASSAAADPSLKDIIVALGSHGPQVRYRSVNGQ
jgi:hypothetical protein